MTTAQRNAIASPAAGLLIYNTNTNSVNFYNGSFWGESGQVVEYNSVPLPVEPTLNFIGAGVTLSDNPSNSSTDILFNGNSSALVRQNFVTTAGQTLFTTLFNFIAGNEEVFKDGALMTSGVSFDYVVSSSNSVTFNSPLVAGLAISVIAPQPIAVNSSVVQTFVATSGQTIFPVTQTFLAGQERVYVNGSRKTYGGSFDYTISGNSIVFNVPRTVGDVVVVEVQSNITATVVANALSTTSVVNLAAAASPIAGQVLTATSASSANWQTPSTSATTATAANALNSATTTVVVNGATAPTTGQVLTATDSTHATWQTATNGISQLTSDVTAGPGAGSQVATVVSVGGSTASAVNNAVVEVAAASSSNTPSALVIRDGSGNFSAGTITASKVGIGTVSPDAAALLDMESTSQGFLPPRMTTTQRNAISSPPSGLIVYDTTLGQLFINI
jgi:hypothetical protein